jgi:hypothetical protein
MWGELLPLAPLKVLDEKGCYVVQSTEKLSGRALDSFRRPIALFQAQKAAHRRAQPFRHFFQALWHG